MLARLLASYRRAGGDLPFGDLGAAHGAPLEGYFWRIADHTRRRVAVAMLGAARALDGTWGVIGLGAHPPSTLRTRVTDDVAVAPDRLNVTSGPSFSGSADHLRVELDPEHRIDVRFRRHRGLPGPWGGLGPAHLVPGLPTYWTPSVVTAEVEGELCFGGEEVSLAGARVYVEKNWGSAYPTDWWWGQTFFDDDASVVFAGGRIPLRVSPGPLASLAPTTVVVQVGDEVTRLGPPLAAVRSSTDGATWHVHARGLGIGVEITGEAGAPPPIKLPVPIPAERRTELRAVEHLAGTLTMTVTRRGRVVYRGESTLAGLEVGLPDPDPDKPAEPSTADQRPGPG